MAYIDVIPLQVAKNHLRVDSSLTVDDEAIIRLINTALSYIERVTRVYVYQRDKTYLMKDGCAYVYDYPINSLSVPSDYDDDDTIENSTYNIYNYGSTTTNLTLNIGYTDPCDVPQELIQVALEMIDLMYYAHETGKNYIKDLSDFSKDVLESNKRFIF